MTTLITAAKETSARRAEPLLFVLFCFVCFFSLLITDLSFWRFQLLFCAYNFPG